MNEPAPKGIIQSADQPMQDLHAETSSNLRRLGHPATQQSVNPHDRSSLENIQEALADITKDQARVIGGTIEEYIGGVTPTTHVGTTTENETSVKKFKEMLWKKLQLKKAA